MPIALAPGERRGAPAPVPVYPTRRSQRESRNAPPPRRPTGSRRFATPPRPASSRPASRGRRVLGAFAGVAAFLLVATVAIAPTAPLLASVAAPGSTGAVLSSQNLAVGDDVLLADGTRDSFTYTDGMQSLIEHGTNHDWAKLVLMFAGWPTSDSNVAVFTRWMRQENGPDDWWNRNNPLNNGYGSGGGSGLGSYDNLVTAAQMAAENLQNYSGYGDIRAGFASSAPEGQIESAIWASPWATSHYGNGANWSHTEVDEVTAPASAWGR